MATIKQVLAAISQDGTLGPNQKRFVTDAILRAETWVNLNAPKKPRKITNAKNLTTVIDWELHSGLLADMPRKSAWVEKNKLCPQAVTRMALEFRSEMIAKGKQYADFWAAFQTYLTKGYLSKTLNDCLLENNRSSAGTTIHTKGVSL